MAASSVLWVDLRNSPSVPDLCSSLPNIYSPQRICCISDIIPAIRDWPPWVICFEYDRPNARGLKALVDTKQRHASLPIVMLTARHTSRLAAWALRCCVWDYLVKPLSVRSLCNCLASVERAVSRSQVESLAILPPHNPAALHALCSVSQRACSLQPAVTYLEANFADKVRLATAARLCDLSPFQFSRNFKKENGVTFRDFVVKLRIDRAADLMKHSQSSVTEAAFAVGFNDLSYFARTFRKQFGISPSRYRAESEPRQLPLFPPASSRKTVVQQITGTPAKDS